MPTPEMKGNIVPVDYDLQEKWCGEMGGRGTFASGNNVAYTYETVDYIENIKVLQGVNGKHNLPEESHSSNAYILTDRNGNFVRYREFNPDHTSKFDIDYHPKKKISDNYNPIYHIHEYKNGVRSPLGRTLTELEYNKYKKYFRGGELMIGGDVKKFIDQTTYEECAIIYNGIKYFFHGIMFDKEKQEYSYVIDVWNSNGNYEKTVFNETASSMKKCLELAQSKPIFEGKTFWEAEPNMEWVEW